MKEFKDERQIIRDELGDIFETFIYEDDAGARSQSIQETYLKELATCHLYIGLFGTGYGEYTIEEFEHARKNGLDCHIYQKECKEIDPRLKEFIEKINVVKGEKSLTIKRYLDHGTLSTSVKTDVARWIEEMVSSKIHGQTNKLAEHETYYCDRKAQYLTFLTSDKNQTFNYFILDGPKYESHKSFVRKICLEQAKMEDVKSIYLSEKQDLNKLKTFIPVELFRVFGIDSITSNPTFKEFLKYVRVEFKKVFIEFEIKEDIWDKTLMNALRWLKSEYCKVNESTQAVPMFYFFITVVYNPPPKTLLSIFNNGWKKRQAQIKKELDHFNGFTKLEELKSIGTNEIEEWIKQHITQNNKTIDNIISMYFKSSNFPICMNDAENILVDLIHDYNDKDPKLVKAGINI